MEIFADLKKEVRSIYFLFTLQCNTEYYTRLYN